MKNIVKYIGMMLIPLSLIIFSCDGDDPVEEASGLAIIYNIKILNAGANGNETVVGTVDETKKEISFPEIAPETDLSKVRFEAEVPEGAKLDEEDYDFTIEEGKSSMTRVVAVVNGKRKREYFTTIRLDLPVWGADFSDEKAKVYDFSGRTTIYPDLTDALTRSADMDLNHVLIVSRATGAHLLKLEDIKKKDTSNPIMLKTTGVSGGIFAVSSGRLSHGHIYICNLATPSETAPLKLYHWASPTAEPEVIASLLSTDINGYTGGRFGDFMSVSLDEDGNGFIFMGANPTQAAYKYIRLKVTGFTTVSDPTLIDLTGSSGGYWTSYNKVDGSADEYLYTGHQAPIRLVNSNGQTLYEVSTSTIPANEGSDAQIINFNKERYLVMMAAPGAGSVDIYDITDGKTTIEALSAFEAGNKGTLTLKKYSLGGAIAAATAAGCIGWAADGDETLYVLGAGPGAGFVVLEFPKKVKEKAE